MAGAETSVDDLVAAVVVVTSVEQAVAMLACTSASYPNQRQLVAAALAVLAAA